MNRGSIWRKWDLHVHSPSSANQKYGSSDDTWDRFVNQLQKKATDYMVEGIGITDYFSIEGYLRLKEYQEKGKLQNILILPNIEFRLDNFVNNCRVNFHVIFSDKLSDTEIEKEFLENLTIKSVCGESRSLRKDNIIEIGRSLKEQQKDFQHMRDYDVGIMNITVSQEDIIKTLDERRSVFEAKYLLVLSQDYWDEIDWHGQDHLTRKILLRKSHALFSANPKTIKWATGQLDINADQFIEEFGSIKPCIWGSDAHDFDRLLKPDKERFTWIKADLSFEGLRQIIFEPSDRVIIQEENPKPRKNIYTLNSIRISNGFINEDLEIPEEEIMLNSDLVAVIGGKGAGKTAFLDLIANCFEDRCKRDNPSREDKNSFVQRIEEEKPDLECEISFIGKETKNYKKKLTDDDLCGEGTIVYMPQGKIEEYSSDRVRLQRKIEDIIFNNEIIKEKEFEKRFEVTNNNIQSIAQKITMINRNIYDLRVQSSSQVTQSLEDEEHKLQGKLQDKKDEINRYETMLDEDKKQKVEMLKKEELNLREKHSRILQTVENLTELREELERFENDINCCINSINDGLASFISKGSISDLLISNIQFSQQFKEIKRADEYLNLQKTTVDQKIKEKEKQISGFAAEERKHATLLKEEIDIENKLKQIKGKLDNIDELKKKIEWLRKERIQEFSNLIKNWHDLKAFYMEIINIFSEGKSEILKDIKFSSHIYFDLDRYIEEGENILDMRSISMENLKEIAERLKTLIGAQSFSEENLDNYVSKEKELYKHLKPVKGDELLFYEWFWGNYFSLATEILFNDIPIKKLSIGQRGTVLLKLILAEGDSPIIIDQPEENLDNKFVYKTLVEAFRESKKKRQVIIATHNANLVVNTDAEQIIVAEYKNNRITFKSGSIENLEIRQEITSILEGGEEAFRRREQKYGMSH